MVGQRHLVLFFPELLVFGVHRGIFPSAISQQIQAIEAHIGVRLRGRTGRKVVQTEAGERYSQLVRDEIERITVATEQMRGANSFTLLNIRVAPTFASEWVPPRLPGFIKSTRA
ncbi:DNA-binding transcriptional LysR family regulator [Sagittula marina]|uniref:DNA-binding transcriptional LysR family regulator n=1 Tax=Sagittula marina TaxID=943940 RepID=A0A7W6DSI9_9RHOB|nr:LysR family transcriptional regulator [Sagittula marina]MBB3985273.1 DNA-binding transcriptional LysR family regulator [Sagittula marina]